VHVAGKTQQSRPKFNNQRTLRSLREINPRGVVPGKKKCNCPEQDQKEKRDETRRRGKALLDRRN